MRISLHGADAARLDVDLSSDGAVRRVSVAGLRAFSGQLERGMDIARLRPLRADAVVLAALEWPLPGGRLSVTTPAPLVDLAIELDAAAVADATPVSGRVSAGRLDADAIAVDLSAGARLVFDAELRRAHVEQSPERTGFAAVDELELANLQVLLGSIVCRLSSAALERSRVDWRAREVLLGAASARASGLSIAAPTAGVTVEIDRVELPGGLRTSGGAVVIPELIVPELRVVVDDVVALFSRPPAAARAPLDVGFLDRVSGHLAVDMTLDISLPVLGRREGTHRFRVPITDGVINYRELERDLAGLEDAFIDVEVRGQSLVIERTIPLIPGLEKPLVVWDLDPDELELARRRLVRLRTIPRMRLVNQGGERDRGEKSSLALRSLRFDDIDIDLALTSPAPGAVDPLAGARIGELRVNGRLIHEPQRSADAAAVTTGRFRAAGLAAGPLELGRGPSGRASIDIESVRLGGIEDGVVSFAGLRPTGASFTGRDLRLSNVRLALR